MTVSVIQRFYCVVGENRCRRVYIHMTKINRDSNKKARTMEGELTDKFESGSKGDSSGPLQSEPEPSNEAFCEMVGVADDMAGNEEGEEFKIAHRKYDEFQKQCAELLDPGE